MKNLNKLITFIKTLYNALIMYISLSFLFFMPFSLSALNILSLPPEHAKIELSSRVEFFLDETTTLTVDEVVEKHDHDFIKTENRFLQMANMSEACWVRIRYRTSESPFKWLLYIDYPHLKSVQVYIHDTLGVTQKISSTGEMFPFQMRDFRHRNFVFKLPEANLEKTIYLRLTGDQQAKLAVSVMDEKTFQENNDDELIMEFSPVYLYFSGLFFLNTLIQLAIFFFKRRHFHFWVAIWTASCGYICAYWYLFYSGLLPTYSFLAGTHLSVNFFCAMLGIFMAICIYEPNFRPSPSLLNLAGFIPGFIGGGRLFILQTDPAFRETLIRESMERNSIMYTQDSFVNLMFNINTLVTILVFLIFTAQKLKWRNIWKDFKAGGIMASISLYFGAIIVIHLLLFMPMTLAPFFPKLNPFQRYLSLVTVGEEFIITLFFQFMPVYINARMHSLKMKEGACQNFVRSCLDGVNLVDLEIRIIELLDKQEVYLDENLNLEGFAKQTGYASKVISEYINSVKKVSFRDFINAYRIKKAIELLNNNRELSIVRAGFDSGFNSIPTFYRLFKKYTGTSPEKYRIDFGQTE